MMNKPSDVDDRKGNLTPFPASGIGVTDIPLQKQRFAFLLHLCIVFGRNPKLMCRKCKYIFLDINGVISTSSSSFCLDRDKMLLLGNLISRTDSWLVITSSCRAADVTDTIYNLTDYDNPSVKGNPFMFCSRIVGITPQIGGNRGEEVKAYLKNRPCDAYIILDDESGMLPEQQPYFIRTDGQKGLTSQDVLKGIEILNRVEEENWT